MTTDSSSPSPRRRPVRAVKPEGQWHHGNLRESLIQWGTHLLDTEGSDAMSLRATAKLAGVSQGAPAYHFGDKNGLLAAIAAQGFRDLISQRQRRLATVDAADGRARLRALLLTYIEFAQAHPARFQLMFGPLLGRRDEYPELIEAGTASFALLRSVVLPLLPSPRSDLLSDDELAHIVWAAVHGLATLRMHRRGAPVRTGPRLSIEQIGDALVRFCMLAFAGLALPAASTALQADATN
ncbi:TetR/AcrR family transcriptional regulator [Pseudorhodoferax sp.]|uniref:TetR/AcrR family transcriptional regulator n=1 Tax=Pseudorhodoferax sp. TaxID=1993553 RepID=UPI002DD68A49|nr:TetR/AcrR family transcriptional regulator [Pseudorhodoferax sp.]